LKAPGLEERVEIRAAPRRGAKETLAREGEEKGGGKKRKGDTIPFSGFSDVSFTSERRRKGKKEGLCYPLVDRSRFR